MNKKLIYFFMFVGSSVGGYVPVLWGDDLFSMSSILWSTVGGFVGIYVGFKLGQRFG